MLNHNAPKSSLGIDKSQAFSGGFVNPPGAVQGHFRSTEIVMLKQT
jgi:hypothetical protein